LAKRAGVGYTPTRIQAGQAMSLRELTMGESDDAAYGERITPVLCSS
jgi:hypothetical protein